MTGGRRRHDIAGHIDELIDSVLAEHPADDDVEADIAWLNALSRQDGDMSMMCVRLGVDGKLFHLCGHGEWVSPKPATRGDVRRLLRALGVGVKK